MHANWWANAMSISSEQCILLYSLLCGNDHNTCYHDTLWKDQELSLLPSSTVFSTVCFQIIKNESSRIAKMTKYLFFNFFKILYIKWTESLKSKHRMSLLQFKLFKGKIMLIPFLTWLLYPHKLFIYSSFLNGNGGFTPLRWQVISQYKVF